MVGRILRIIFIYLGLLFGEALTAGVESDRTAVRRLLTIDCFSWRDDWNVSLRQGFQQAMADAEFPVDCDHFQLLFRDDRQPVNLTELQKRLRSVQYDLILIEDKPVADLFLNGLLPVAGDVPVLVLEYDGTMVGAGRPNPVQLAGIENPCLLYSNIELALRLLPGNRRITVIADTPPSDWEKLRREFNAVELTIISGTACNTEEMLAAVRTLPADSVVIFLSWDRHWNRDPEHDDVAFCRIRKSFPGLILCQREVYLPLGAAGGYLYSGFRQGEQGGMLGLRLLQGVPPAELPVRRAAPFLELDYTALKRAGVAGTRIPGCAVLHNVSRFGWNFYWKWAVFGLLAALVGLGGYAVWQRRQTWRQIDMICARLPQRIMVIAEDGRILFLHILDSPDWLSRRKLGHLRQLESVVGQDIRLMVERVFQSGKREERLLRSEEQWRNVECIRLPDRNPFRCRAVLWISTDITELYRTQQEYAQLAERSKMTLQAIGDGVIVTDPERRITLINPVAARLTGYPAAEALGRKIEEVFHTVEVGGRETGSLLARALETRETAQTADSVVLVDRNGLCRHIVDNAAPISADGGTLSGGVLVFRDVTGEYEKREKLKQNDLLLKNAGKIAQFCHFSCSLDGKLTSSPIDEEFWPRENGRPLAAARWICPADLARLKQSWHDLIEGKVTEFELLYSAGRELPTRHFEIWMKKIRSEISGQTEIFGVIQDITRSRESELASRNSLQLLEAIMDNLPGYIFVKQVDDDFRYRMANRKFCEIVGRPAAEIIGRTDAEFFTADPEAAAKMREDDWTAATSGHPLEIQEKVTNLHRESITVRTTKSLLVRLDGTRLLVGMGIDISELIRQQEALRRAMELAQVAERAKGLFIASVTHELRTPLNAIIGFSELLRKEASAGMPAEQKEYLEAIAFAGNTLLRLINDVLMLSRLETGQFELKPEAVDVEALLREVHAAFRLQAGEKSLTLELNCTGLPGPLCLDLQRFRQIMLNLVGNAVKFTVAGGVRIRAGYTAEAGAGGGTLAVEVADTGIGIPPEEAQTIFEPFSQAEGTRGHRVYEGSGLGLAIAKRLLEAMNGTIRMDSVPGRGSVFTVILRKVQCWKEPVQPSAVSDNRCRLETLRLLLVDDVPMNLKVLQALLKKWNVPCLVADSGRQALRLLDRHPDINLVLTDLWMPEMDGRTLAEQLAANPRTARIPVVAVTADSRAANIPEHIFQGVILKPVTPAALEALLKRFVPASPAG